MAFSTYQWMFGLLLAIPASCLRLEVVQQEEGEQVQLHCVTDNETNASNLTWSRYTGGEYVPIVFDNNRITNKTVVIDESTTLNMLQINQAHRDDGGSYRCETQERQVIQEVQLQIYKLPVIFANSSDYEEMMWEEDKDLWCWADGYPGLSVIWTRVNNQLFNAGEHSYKGQHLKVIKARQEYAGVYTCTASITGFQNASVSHNVTLIVEGPPHNYGSPNEYIAYPGDNVSLPCAVVGYPEPDVTWSRTGKVMGADIDHYLVVEVPINECSKNSTLNIISVNEDDYETYLCEVKNVYGKSEVRYTLKNNII